MASDQDASEGRERRRLSGVDSLFLGLEAPSTPMHVALALVLDPGGATVRQLADDIGRRLRTVPDLRATLAEVPFGLQRPRLAPHAELDVGAHVRTCRLPAPGGPRELETLVAAEVARALDRHRPLWEVVVADGLEGGRVAVVGKVHHALVDGMAGIETMAALFGPAGPPDAPAADPDPVPGDVGGGADDDPLVRHGGRWRVADDAARLADAVCAVPDQVGHVARAFVRTLRSARDLSRANRGVAGELPPSPFGTPRTSLNGAVSSERVVALAELPMSEVARVRHSLGGTVNDVLLTVAAGGLRALLEARGEVPEPSLVAMVPVSVRPGSNGRAEGGGAEGGGAEGGQAPGAPEPGNGYELGNQLSAVLVSLPTGVEDPVARLRLVQEGEERAKRQHRVMGEDLLGMLAEVLVPAVTAPLARVAADVRAFDHLPPVANLVVSNVPGPGTELSVGDARVVAAYPLGPVAHGIGVNVTVLSYGETLYVGIVGCGELAPDVHLLAAGMRDDLALLAAAAGQRRRPVPWWHRDLVAGA